MRYIIRKNNKFYTERESLDDALWELECLSRMYRDTGDIIIEHTDRLLLVSCENNDITYKIEIIQI